MKGTFTLAVYIAIGATGAAFGQPVPSVLKYAASPVPISTLRAIPSDGWLPPDQRLRGDRLPVTLTPAPLPPIERAPDTVIIRYGKGGLVEPHKERFLEYRLMKTKVEIRGPCYSACTLITSYVEPENLCIAEGAFFAFHAVRGFNTGERMDTETLIAYKMQPMPIQRWIERNGGHEKLPLDGYWTMYDRELWAIGYPRCK